MDESGHDHRTMPYEVRGGVALHVSTVWPFELAWKNLEQASFGCQLGEYRLEIKGSHLLDKDRWKWAAQGPRMPETQRQSLCRKFLTKGLEKKRPARDEFTAYGQACLEMARGIFDLVHAHEGVVFAAAIPRNVVRPNTFEADEFLRKDHVFLFERFFYFLDEEQSHGVVVMDESDKMEDGRFVRRMQDYFTKTSVGRYRASRIVPSPLFVASEMSHGVQAADICMYALNVGFRLPKSGMSAEVRMEIAEEFGPWLHSLQWKGVGHRQGDYYTSYGITFVPDPYGSAS
jgi:hypothetical protein